jgi:DMSO/TMAO reductase YedYZ molybdopterin-dependent catalytic subunit
VRETTSRVQHRLRTAAPVAAVAGSASASALVGSYVVAGATPRFVVAPVSSVVVDSTPALVLRFAITVLGDLGHQVGFALAVLATLVLLALAALPGAVATWQAGADRHGRRALGAVLGGALPGATALALTVAPQASLAAGVAATIVTGIAGIAGAAGGAVHGTTDEATTSASRRSALAAVGTATLAGLVGVGPWRDGRGSDGDGAPSASQAAAGPDQEVADAEADAEEDPPLGGETTASMLATARERSLDVEDLEPLVSDRFYNVDINNIDPQVAPDGWTLTVTGEIDTDHAYSYEEIREMDAESRFVTLRCVGDDRNGRKLDNAVWTGVPMARLLEGVDPGGDCGCVKLHAHDGYYQVFPVEALERGFLAYGMNGEPLPREHGAPVRVLIPGHWGEINVKWLDEVEFLDQEADGYWEERGWHGTGPVNTVAKLWVTNRLDDGRIEVAGAAYAGLRGVSAVQVSTDGGETWTDADLSESLPGEDVWRQWVHRYDPPGGEHEVVVRAVEADGTIQPREETGPFPRGAKGWVSTTVEP